MSEREVVIIINPGSTSTKFALFNRTGPIVERVVRHTMGELAPRATDQFEQRARLIDQELEPLVKDYQVVGVVGRGGLLKPLEGGTYRVNEKMLEDLRSPTTDNHASNLGAFLAYHYGGKYGVPAFIVDPVTVDEFTELARLSGVTWCQRKSRSHALNIKACVRRACRELGIKLAESRFVVAHLGGGISVAAVEGGRIIDVNDALLGMGPYSPERAGALPLRCLIERCYSGEVSKEELIDELSRRSGLVAYTGTSDVREVLHRAQQGEKSCQLAIEGMVYQVAKEIGACSAVLKGKLDGVIITGGVAQSSQIVDMIKSYVLYLGKLLTYPGEGELEALAEGAFRVIDGEEEEKEYR